MPYVLGVIATCALAVGMAFIFGKTVPIMPNKVLRFVFLFALGVPINFVFNYVHVWAFGYHKLSWTGAIVIGLLLAANGGQSPHHLCTAFPCAKVCHRPLPVH